MDIDVKKLLKEGTSEESLRRKLLEEIEQAKEEIRQEEEAENENLDKYRRNLAAALVDYVSALGVEDKLKEADYNEYVEELADKIKEVEGSFKKAAELLKMISDFDECTTCSSSCKPKGKEKKLSLSMDDEIDKVISNFISKW